MQWFDGAVICIGFTVLGIVLMNSKTRKARNRKNKR